MNSSHDRWYTSLFIDEANEELRLRSNKESIEECMYQLNIMRNCNAIKLYEYKVHRNIYDFIKVQDEQTRFAPRYDLITGDPICNKGSLFCPFLDTYNRFGSPKEFINYLAIVSEFADYALADEMNALIADYAYQIRQRLLFEFDYNVENDASKMNISINKDYLCLQYRMSYLGMHTSDYSNGYPVTIHLGAFGWFQTTGERLKNSYIRFIKNRGRRSSSFEIPQEYTEIIDELSCDTYY